MNKEDIDKMMIALNDLHTFIKNDERKKGKYSHDFGKDVVNNIDILYILARKSGIQNAVDTVQAINNAIYYKNLEQFETAKIRLESILNELKIFLEPLQQFQKSHKDNYDELSRILETLQQAQHFKDPTTIKSFNRLCSLAHQLKNQKVDKAIKVMKLMLENEMTGDLKNLMKSFQKIVNEDQQEKAKAKTSPVTTPRETNQ